MGVGSVVGSPDVLGVRRFRRKPYWGFKQRGGIGIVRQTSGDPRFRATATFAGRLWGCDCPTKLSNSEETRREPERPH